MHLCAAQVYQRLNPAAQYHHQPSPLRSATLTADAAHRPVECASRQPLQYTPGYINETIYGDMVETGWSWNAYSQNNKQLQVRLVSHIHEFV